MTMRPMTEADMREALDGSFRHVGQYSGEYKDLKVAPDFMPDYSLDWLGILALKPRNQKPSPKKKSLSNIENHRRLPDYDE